MTPSISIVTACYNSAPFLGRIHGSLLKQTYRNFEWVCVDDVSKDDTIERLIALEPPGELGMQVYRLPQNTGGPVALAVGTKVARGDIVIWLDHDDELFPDALENVRKHWPVVGHGDGGLLLRASDPTSGAMIGRKLPEGTRLSWGQINARYPDVHDATFVFRAHLLREFASIERMEEINLNGAVFAELTRNHPLIVTNEPARFYHRDNPDSQTRVERVSRKSVATYARIFDGLGWHAALSPGRWTRHVVTMFRYSGLVYGRHGTALRHVRSWPRRVLASLLLPLSLLVRYRNANEVLVDIPYFDPALAEGLHDLRKAKP
ncbi:MAG: glycosyltransferase family 2 protein [Sphingomonas sp.]|nr:glycosyltransferase family 2 protein [Sphingomonas sp.]